MRLRDLPITLDDVLAGLIFAVFAVGTVWIAAGLSPDLVSP